MAFVFNGFKLNIGTSCMTILCNMNIDYYRTSNFGRFEIKTQEYTRQDVFHKLDF